MLPDPTNLLPHDGTVLYYPSVISENDAQGYFVSLFESIEWKNDEVYLFGKRFVTKRMVAWYGDEEFLYTYSNQTKKALRWTTALLELKRRVEEQCNQSFNSCLLNLYHDGEEGMGWHSDDERELGKNPTIASVSLGAARKFSFKHKITGEHASLLLESGSILLMKDQTQHYWLHALPKSKKIKEPRINLTFRSFKS